MLNFEKELEKFQPSMDVEQVEDVVYNNTDFHSKKQVRNVGKIRHFTGAAASVP